MATPTIPLQAAPVPSAPAASAAPQTQQLPVSSAPPSGGTPSVPTTMEEALAQLAGPDPTPAPVGDQPIPDQPVGDQPVPDAPVDPNAPPAAPGTPVEAQASTEDTPIDGPDLEGTFKGKPFYYFEKSKGQRLVEASKVMGKVRELMPDFSPETFQEVLNRSNAAQTMMASYHRAADPQIQPQERQAVIGDLVGYFAEESPVALGFLAIEAQGNLLRSNPQAFQAIHNGHVQKIIGDMRGRIANSVDPTVKQKEIAFFQNLEYRLTGKFTPADVLMSGGPTAPQQSAVDPQAQQVQQGLQRIQDFERQQAVNARTALNNRIAHAEDSALVGPIEASLTGVRPPAGADPNSSQVLRYNFLVQTFRQKIAEAETANPTLGSQYRALLTQAQLTGSDADISRLTSFREQHAKSFIRTNGPKIVQAVMGPASPPNGGQPPAPPQNGPSLTGVGTPASPNGADALLKADNWQDMFKAVGIGQR